MKSNEILVLSKSVSMVPVLSLSPELRKRFESQTGDIVITNHGTRGTSKLISHEISDLLGQFKNPKTAAEAIHHYATNNHLDAIHVADEFFPFLLELKYSGFLIPLTGVEDIQRKTLLAAGDSFREYRVVGQFGILEDTEVYQVADARGNLFALKLLLPSVNSGVKSLYENEIKILQRLDGKVNPVLKTHGKQDEILYLVTEWVVGSTCMEEADKFRNLNFRNNVVNLLDLCIKISMAFYHLHRQGVMHGDITPGHIFISNDGMIRLIDFGYAAVKEDRERIQRGGNGYYFEPEFARAVTGNLPYPSLTEAGEQYAIAAVMYKLLTGFDYLHFFLEKGKFYRQISEDSPLPFLHFDILLPAELEAVLKKALSKESANRYTSMQGFADALQEVRSHVLSGTGLFALQGEKNEQRFTEYLVRKFGWESPLIVKGLSFEPTRSVYYGSAGIAYMFYRMSCVREDASMLSLADLWINRALGFENEFEKSFYSAALEIDSSVVGNRSLYHGPAGVYLVHALISLAKGDDPLVSKSLSGFLQTIHQPCEKIDLALGTAGALLGSSILYRELLAGRNDWDTTQLENTADDIMKDLWAELMLVPSMNEPNSVNYFGVAHGWTGILYATLHWCGATGNKLPEHFQRRLRELIDCRVGKNKTVYWPVSLNEQHPWTGWCNGSAGNLLFWLQAYNYFKDEEYLKIAEGLASHFAGEWAEKNANLCCGLGGQVYAMMALYKTTRDKEHLDTAERMKQTLLKNLSSPLMHNNSLFKGEAGIGVLFCESENPDLFRMPLFE